MIIAQLFGGLGNQMFQYAAGRALACRHDTEYKLDISPFRNKRWTTPREYSLSPFTVEDNFALETDLSRIRHPERKLQKYLVDLTCTFRRTIPIQLIREQGLAYNPGFLIWPDNVCLQGYWQSEKYFKDIADIIRSDFKLSAKPDSRNEKTAGHIRSCESVSLHIRRGDYVLDPATNAFHGTCSPDYYQHAISFIETKVSNPHFFIFSDDPAWVRKNMDTAHPTSYIDFNGPDNACLDMHLMSLCHHHIIANSSFSWWGAWLADYCDKIIIAPKKWFNKPDLNTDDLIPDSWIQQ
jgi:hypothetical protein